jgi:hypothetical protein
MVRKYKESMVQKLIESFDTNSTHLARFSVFNPVTLEVQTGFGNNNELLEGVERDLGINQGWLADQENKDGTTVDVVGHRKAIAQTLHNRLGDIDDANHSGPSRCTNFSQSTGNSSVNSDTMTCQHIFWEKALKNIDLVNKNSTLTNELAESEDKIATILSQNILLQQQLAALMKSTAKTAAGPSARDEDMEEEDGLPLDMRGGGGNSWLGQEDAEPLAPGMPVEVGCPVQHYFKDTMMDDDGPDMIRSGGGQGSGSKSSEDPLKPKVVRNLPWGYGEAT